MFYPISKFTFTVLRVVPVKSVVLGNEPVPLDGGVPHL